MRRGRLHGGQRGTSLSELLVVAAVLVVISAAALPMFFSYLRASTVRAGAEELVGILNLARSVAIRENVRVCVPRDTTGSNRVRILLAAANPCGATTSFYGAEGRGVDPRIDASGWFTLQNGVAVTAATADVVFSALGAAVPGGTYTVARNEQALNVVVAPSGRISVAP